MKWTKGGGKELPGLVRRRKAEADLYFTEYEFSTKSSPDKIHIYYQIKKF